MKTNRKTKLSAHENFAFGLEGGSEDRVKVLTPGVGRVDKIDFGVGTVPAQLSTSQETTFSRGLKSDARIQSDLRSNRDDTKR